MSEDKKDHCVHGVRKYRPKSPKEILKNTKKYSKGEKIPLTEKLRKHRHKKRSIMDNPY